MDENIFRAVFLLGLNANVARLFSNKIAVTTNQMRQTIMVKIMLKPIHAYVIHKRNIVLKILVHSITSFL